MATETETETGLLDRFASWASRHFASLIVVLVLMVGGAGLAWSVHETDAIRRSGERARRELCMKENEVRAEIISHWHRWAELGIPPASSARAVAEFLAELDTRLTPVDCDNL